MLLKVKIPLLVRDHFLRLHQSCLCLTSHWFLYRGRVSGSPGPGTVDSYDFMNLFENT